MGPADQVSLECVRVRGSLESAAVIRLRTAHLLATARLQPAAMPPSAVLVVRAVADPLPGRIAEFSQPPAAVSREWERAVQDRLGELYARAARPAFGPVAPSVEAVRFADYGELLACLASDASSGAASAWWWQSFLKRYAAWLPAGWSALWEDQAVYVPAALEQLAVRNRAVSVLEPLAPAQAWRIAVAVVRAFGLPGSCLAWHGPAPLSAATAKARAIVDRSPSMASRAPDRLALERRSESDVLEAAATTRRPRPPWEPIVPAGDVPGALGLEKRILLGLGLLLRRAPAVALSERFQVRLQMWLAEQAGPSWEVERHSPSPQSTGDSAEAGKASIERAGRSIAPSKLQPPGHSWTAPAVPSAEKPVGEPSAEPPLQNASRRRVDSQPDLGSGAVTQLGGILYLIHLLRQAELVHHFEIGLSGWALLDLLARCLLGARFSEDPIWEALAELDGRDPQVPPGLGFRPQATYTAAASWLCNLDDRPPLVRYRTQTIEVWRPEGFLVLDSTVSSTRGGPVPRQLRRAVAVRPAAIPVSPELRRFLHFVLPYARWRLMRALRGIPIEEVLSRRGTLILSSTHIDLVMSMRQISVPIRAAGLDGNPGWVPELGRIVTFHFVPEGRSD
jgi:hypothetical protein